MKTSLQEMLEWTRKTFQMELDTPRMIESKIESLLEKEKEQIMMAYNDGFINAGLKQLKTSTEYYHQTHN